jgi:hypothetical protein
VHLREQQFAINVDLQKNIYKNQTTKEKLENTTKKKKKKIIEK